MVSPLMSESESSISGSRRRLPLSALRAFESAARLGSFRKAAEELGVTPTAISHQVRGLESLIETPLFTRHVRRVVLTEAGTGLLPVLRQGFDAFEEALRSAALRRGNRAVVTIGATSAFMARWLVPRLALFRQAEPSIDLQLAASNGVASVAHGEVDIAIRYGGGVYPGHEVELLWSDTFAPVCHPLLGVRGIAGIGEAALVAFSWKRPAPQNPTWERWSKKAGVRLPADTRFLHFSDETHAIQAVIAGQGIGLLSTLLVEPELSSGSLVESFGPRMDAHGYYLLTRQGQARAAVDAVATWIRQQFLVDPA